MHRAPAAIGTHIVPVVIGDDARVVRIGRELAQRGFLVGAVRPPTVPVGGARLRITVSAAHTAGSHRATRATPSRSRCAHDARLRRRRRRRALRLASVHPARTARCADRDRAAPSGAYLVDNAGRRIFDAISSWWVTLHGHAQPEIAAAIAEQARTLEQVIFAGFTHEPGARLAAELIARAPAGLQRVFFSDDGSTAVEVAVKIALQYWQNRGEDRRLIAALENAYHGDTFGAMSVSDRGLFTDPFAAKLFEVARLPDPVAGDVVGALEQLIADARQRARRGDRRAAAPRRRRHAHVVRRRCCASFASSRAAHGILAHRRRGAHRLRPHRADVRLRARRRVARSDVSVEGTDRRFRAARRDAGDRGAVRGVPLGRPYANALSRTLIYRESRSPAPRRSRRSRCSTKVASARRRAIERAHRAMRPRACPRCRA